jgi:hypothetical protein
MLSLAQKIMHIYPDAIPMVNFIVRNDGDGRGEYLEYWDLPSPPPTQEELDNAVLGVLKKEKKDELNDKCQTEILSGFVASNGHFYWFDFKDQDNLTQQMVFLVHDPTINEVSWKTGEGIISHTRDEFLRVCSDANAFKRNRFVKYWTLCAQLEACTTEEEVNAIQW